MLIRCLRPDKVVIAIISLINEILGPKYVEYPLFDMEESFKSTNALKPIIFLLSPGIDPVSIIIEFSRKQGISEKNLKILSLGQGQGRLAENLVKEWWLGYFTKLPFCGVLVGRT